MKTDKSNLREKDALHVQRARLWLQAGRAAKALKELQQLTKRAWAYPWTEKIIWETAVELEKGLPDAGTAMVDRKAKERFAASILP